MNVAPRNRLEPVPLLGETLGALPTPRSLPASTLSFFSGLANFFFFPGLQVVQSHWPW